MKRIIMFFVVLLVATGCWHPNHGDYGTAVKWPCGTITVSAQGTPTFVQQTTEVVNEIASLSGRSVVNVPVGAVQVRQFWPADAPSASGWAGVPPGADGQYHGGQVLVNPNVPDWLVKPVLRHELAHAMGLGHDDDGDVTLMRSDGSGVYQNGGYYSPMDIMGLRVMLTCNG